MELAATNVSFPGGSWNLIVETSHIFHRCLSPGPSLEKMERAALTSIQGYLDDLASEPNDAVVNLFSWLRTVMTVGTTEAVSLPTSSLFLRLSGTDSRLSSMGHGIR